jgi:hypothetical protein
LSLSHAGCSGTFGGASHSNDATFVGTSASTEILPWVQTCSDGARRLDLHRAGSGSCGRDLARVRARAGGALGDVVVAAGRSRAQRPDRQRALAQPFGDTPCLATSAAFAAGNARIAGAIVVNAASVAARTGAIGDRSPVDVRDVDPAVAGTRFDDVTAKPACRLGSGQRVRRARRSVVARLATCFAPPEDGVSVTLSTTLTLRPPSSRR